MDRRSLRPSKTSFAETINLYSKAASSRPLPVPPSSSARPVSSRLDSTQPPRPRPPAPPSYHYTYGEPAIIHPTSIALPASGESLHADMTG
eukprot:scaffold69825_cov31-Prasinocladus_malaysianus.AAC.2